MLLAFLPHRLYLLDHGHVDVRVLQGMLSQLARRLVQDITVLFDQVAQLRVL